MSRFDSTKVISDNKYYLNGLADFETPKVRRTLGHYLNLHGNEKLNHISTWPRHSFVS